MTTNHQPSDRSPGLADPIQLRDVPIRNRLVMTAHDTNMATSNHLVSQEQIAYFARRAEGGVGMIVMEATSVHPTAEIHGTSVHAYKPEVVAGYTQLADEVHERGSALVVQLAHQGVHMNFNKNLTAAWGPSRVPSVVEREMPHVVSIAEIRELIDHYALSARHVSMATLDGVEVSASHSYLPAQFLSPWYNKREDAYGGSFENRSRFLREVLEAVRAEIGASRVLGVRISGDELTEFGMTVDDAVQLADALDSSALVDYLSVSVGSMHTRHMIVPPMDVESGYQIPIVERLRCATSMPLIAIGRITDVSFANQIIERGIADLVGMTRAQIADPDLARKFFESREGEIIPCIGCNQACRQRFFLGKHISCTVNPTSGREKWAVRNGTDTEPRRVGVVGGGPAGMQAALSFAERNKKVSLFEKADHLGGQLNTAAMLPGRGDLRDYLDFLSDGLRRMDVEVQLGTPIEAIASLDPEMDLVVLATGSRPTRRPQEGYASDGLDLSGLHNWSAADAAHDLIKGRHVVVVDETGRYEGLGVCDHLSTREHLVTYVTSLSAAGRDLHATGDYPILMARLIQKGVDVLTEHRVDRSSDEGLILTNIYDPDRKRVAEGAIDVVWVCGNEPVLDLDPGPDSHVEFKTIGDAFAPRGLDEAVFDAYRVAGVI